MTLYQEITSDQLESINYAISQGGTVTVALCKEGDTEDTKRNLDRLIADCNHLVELGFLKDITNEYQIYLDKAEMQSGRKHVVLAVTKEGQLFFSTNFSQVVH